MKLTTETIKQLSQEIAELVISGTPIAEAVKIVWTKHQIPNKLFDSAKAEAIKAVYAELGSLSVSLAGSNSIAWDKLVNQGGEVKAQVSKASARARLDIEEEVKKILKSGEAVKVASTRLRKAGADPVAIRKDIDLIAKFGGSPDEIRKLRAKVTSGLKGRELRASYRGVLDAVENGTEKQIAKQIEIATIRKTESNMQRIVRTEQARAHFASQREVIAQEGVGFVRFVLAGGHEADECDAYANADMGYGKGVYPVDQAPVLPIHPNGRSILVPVYRPKKSGKEVDPETALENQAKELDVKLNNGIKLDAIVKKL